MPAARTHDPDTSHAAARSAHSPSEVQQRIFGILQTAAMGGARSGLTDEQIAERYRVLAERTGSTVPTGSSLRSRRAELVAAGKVRRSTVNGKSATGRVAAQWIANA